jgi:gas vesicle protein
MENNQSKKILAGVVIGGVIGAVALYLINASKTRKVPMIKRFGKTISDVGEMLENCDIDCTKIADNIEEKLPKGSDIISNAADWLDMGMKIWKKFK